MYVSGTTATNEKGIIVGHDDPYTQTVQSLKNIETALQAVGVRLKDVVRTRIYIKNIDDWEKIGRRMQRYSQIFVRRAQWWK